MPESTWPSPMIVSPAAGPGPDAQDAAARAARRRRLTLWGSVLVALGLVGAGVVGVLAWRVIVGSSERFTAPGTVEMSCDGGSRWRIGPQTGSSRTVGPVTVSTTRDAALPLDAVRVTAADGTPLPVTTLDVTETFSTMGAEYVALYTFRCPPGGGDVTVTVADVGGAATDVAVFPAFGDVMRSLVMISPVGIAAIAALVGGIIALAVRPRAPTPRR